MRYDTIRYDTLFSSLAFCFVAASVYPIEQLHIVFVMVESAAASRFIYSQLLFKKITCIADFAMLPCAEQTKFILTDSGSKIYNTFRVC